MHHNEDKTTHTHYLRGQEVQGINDKSLMVQINLVRMFLKHMPPDEYPHTVQI